MHQQLLNNVRCICFDLDDTLWPLKSTISNAEKMAIAYVHEQAPACSATFIPTTLAQARTKILQDQPELRHKLTEFRFQVYQAAIASCISNPKESAAIAKQAVETFLFYRNQVVPFEGVETILDKLNSKYVLGAITNGNVSFDSLDISRYFSFYVSAEQVGASKPDGKIFAHAYQECLRFDAGLKAPEEVLHVGDDKATDVEGANNFGFLSAWLNPLDNKANVAAKRQETSNPAYGAPTVEIRSLFELIELLPI